MQGRRRRIRLSAYAVAAALLLFAVALGYSAFQTHRHLRDAQMAVGLLRAGLVNQKTPAAEVEQRLATVQREADAARSLTDGPLWGVPAAVPWLGRPFETVRGASAAVSRVAHDVLPPVRAARDGLVGVDLTQPKGGIDLRPVAAAEKPLGQASRSSDAVLADVSALPVSGVGPVDQARADLLGQLQDLSGQLRSTHEAVSLLPPMLGADGPRRYMVAFQNNAEARGSGGLPGVYAVRQGRPGPGLVRALWGERRLQRDRRVAEGPEPRVRRATTEAPPLAASSATPRSARTSPTAPPSCCGSGRPRPASSSMAPWPSTPRPCR